MKHDEAEFIAGYDSVVINMTGMQLYNRVKDTLATLSHLKDIDQDDYWSSTSIGSNVLAKFEVIQIADNVFDRELLLIPYSSGHHDDNSNSGTLESKIYKSAIEIYAGLKALEEKLAFRYNGTDVNKKWPLHRMMGTDKNSTVIILHERDNLYRKYTLSFRTCNKCFGYIRGQDDSDVWPHDSWSCNTTTEYVVAYKDKSIAVIGSDPEHADSLFMYKSAIMELGLNKSIIMDTASSIVVDRSVADAIGIYNNTQAIRSQMTIKEYLSMVYDKN